MTSRGLVGIGALALLLMALAAACGSQPAEKGVLQGHVTIGPLLPVVQEGVPEPTPVPEAYAARQIVVYAADGKREVARVQIDAHGDYRVELDAGRYVVDINRLGIDSAAGLPGSVEIVPEQVTVLDVDIDTGIR